MSDWDERWVRVFEMSAGAEENLPHAKQIVNAEMERIGNRVGRPLVMKVKVEVVSGEINKPDKTGDKPENTD